MEVSEDDLRRAVALPPEPPTGDDGARHAEARRPAAVMIPVLRGAEGLSVLLTLRPDNMRDHAGQIAFPGGKIDAGDATPLAAALRETEEEVGLGPDALEVLGPIERYRTGTGFCITPFVALAAPGAEPRPEPGEIAALFAPPLDFLMDPANHRRLTGEWRGARRRYWAMPWRDRFIWGATAGMLRRLSERVAAIRATDAA